MKRILPSYPLFVKDPYFSIWSNGDVLNDQNTQFWFGATKRIYGLIKLEEKTYCFLGNANDLVAYGVEKAEQLDVKVNAFSTDYQFKVGNATLKISFVSPLPLDDLDLLSLPVCYMEYEIIGATNAEVTVLLNRELCYNDIPETPSKSVRAGVINLIDFEAGFIGLCKQMPLSNGGDEIGADWGYYYLGGESVFVLDDTEIQSLINGELTFKANGEERYLCSINKSLKGMVMVGYDDTVSIDYYGKLCKGYYLENHTILDGLKYVFNNAQKINNHLSIIEKDLIERALPFGQDYVDVLMASLRQSIAGHKLVRDENGDVLWLSKENASDGCIATVDVSYPSMPLFLLYNPELVKGMMRPIIKYAGYDVWCYDFAPHDAGTYPLCYGQLYAIQQLDNKYHAKYGVDKFFCNTTSRFPLYILPANFDTYNFNRQMPVEECANMLIMLLAVYDRDGDIDFFKQNAQLYEKWCTYLVKYGLKPENQLCTDDFAGHLANNLNLAIKATVGIGAFAKLLLEIGETEKSAEYRKIAEEYAKTITEFANGKTHLPITWDTGEETFSLKYNLAFDKILKLDLFPQELLEKEVDYYILKTEKYGVPLDNRKMYTKSDWIIWASSLTDDVEKAKKLIKPINEYLKETPSRIPFGDWYETVDGTFHMFKARTVQGGCFILLLK